MSKIQWRRLLVKIFKEPLGFFRGLTSIVFANFRSRPVQGDGILYAAFIPPERIDLRISAKYRNPMFVVFINRSSRFARNFRTTETGEYSIFLRGSYSAQDEIEVSLLHNGAVITDKFRVEMKI